MLALFKQPSNPDFTLTFGINFSRLLRPTGCMNRVHIFTKHKLDNSMVWWFVNEAVYYPSFCEYCWYYYDW